MSKLRVPSRWLALALVSAAASPFACSKPDPAPEGAPTAVAEAIVAADAPSTAASTEPAPEDAPAASASMGSDAPTASAADAPSSGKSVKAPPAERAPAPPTPNPAPPAGYTGPDPCRATSFKFASVRNACAQGGVKQAKSLMKGMVKRAKDDGKDLKCSSCHQDTKTYTLKPNAVDDLRALQ